jgi:hypothetical protein
LYYILAMTMTVTTFLLLCNTCLYVGVTWKNTNITVFKKANMVLCS